VVSSYTTAEYHAIYYFPFKVGAEDTARKLCQGIFGIGDRTCQGWRLKNAVAKE
jgi:hypothetical protein